MAILGRNVFDFCFYFILAISALDPGVQTVNTPRSNGSERLNWKNAVNVRQTDALLKLEEEMKALEERVEQIEEKSRQGKDKKCVCEHWEEKFKLQMLEKEIQLQRKPGVQVFKRVKKSSGSQNESQNFNAEINDNAYNGHTGIFTSPSTGVFAFSWTMNSERSGHYELMHNSEVKTITTSESSVRPHVERASVSATIVLELRENDVVFLRTHHARGQGIFIVSNSLMQSSFSGWQVY